MPIALTPSETWEYQLQRERVTKQEADASGGALSEGAPHPERTVFRLGALTARQHARVEDARASAGIDPDGTVTTLYHRAEAVSNEALIYGLRGWERFQDAAGADVPWPSGGGGKMAERALDYLSAADRNEVAQAILRGNRVTVSEGN